MLSPSLHLDTQVCFFAHSVEELRTVSSCPAAAPYKPAPALTTIYSAPPAAAAPYSAAPAAAAPPPSCMAANNATGAAAGAAWPLPLPGGVAAAATIASAAAASDDLGSLVSVNILERDIQSRQPTLFMPALQMSAAYGMPAVPSPTATWHAVGPDSGNCFLAVSEPLVLQPLLKEAFAAPANERIVDLAALCGDASAVCMSTAGIGDFGSAFGASNGNTGGPPLQGQFSLGSDCGGATGSQQAEVFELLIAEARRRRHAADMATAAAVNAALTADRTNALASEFSRMMLGLPSSLPASIPSINSGGVLGGVVDNFSSGDNTCYISASAAATVTGLLPQLHLLLDDSCNCSGATAFGDASLLSQQSCDGFWIMHPNYSTAQSGPHTGGPGMTGVL